jgi:hypothetical protein
MIQAFSLDHVAWWLTIGFLLASVARTARSAYILGMVLFLVASGLSLLFLPKAEKAGVEAPSDWWVRTLLNSVKPKVQFSNASDDSYFLVEAGADGPDDEMLAAASPRRLGHRSNSE